MELHPSGGLQAVNPFRPSVPGVHQKAQTAQRVHTPRWCQINSKSERSQYVFARILMLQLAFSIDRARSRESRVLLALSTRDVAALYFSTYSSLRSPLGPYVPRGMVGVQPICLPVPNESHGRARSMENASPISYKC